MTDAARIHLPDAPPDVRFAALPRDLAAFRYSFAVKQAAMRTYIEPRWGWDDALQKQLHRERLDAKPFARILWRDRAVGTVSLMRMADHVRFGEFYLFPEYQRLGLGSRILRHCLLLTDATSLPVRLVYLKWNPVGTLYRRHGFAVAGETETHWLMERPPSDSSGFAFDRHAD
jgi:GNAT superfamily N-acetyltransferase